MKYLVTLLILVLSTCFLVGCQWPKVFVKSSSGYVSYDRLNHRLEVIWESTTESPADTTGHYH